MEVSIFPKPEVRLEKSKFVEARLHSDTLDPELNKRIAGLIETVARSTAQPIYVAMDPSTETELGRKSGTEGGAPVFIRFLEAMVGKI